MEDYSYSRHDTPFSDVFCEGQVYPFYFFVYQDSSIEDICGKTISNDSFEYPDFLFLAVALLKSDYSHIQYIYVENTKEWVSVNMNVDRSMFARPRVMLSYKKITPPNGLSVRELDVLTLLSIGLDNPSIADYLYISPKTVAKHIENIFFKLEAKNRTHAGFLAINQGLIRYPTPGNCREGHSNINRLEQEMESNKNSKQLESHFPLSPLSPCPIKIGIPLPFGLGSANAEEMLNGASLAVHEINARGGINGRELRILTADYNLQNPHSLRETYTYFINQDVAAISAAYSSEELSIHTLMGEYGAPYLHSATLESAVNNVRNSPSELGNIFQVCASDVKYGPEFANFISCLCATKLWIPANKHISIVMPQWAELDIGIEEMEKILDAQGWAIEILSSADVDNRNWDKVCEALQYKNTGVIILASYLVEDGIGFQEAFFKNPVPALVYMLYNPSVAGFCSQLGEKAEGVLWATTSGIYTDYIGTHFRNMYLKSFGKESGESQAGLAYDRINILANAWARVGNPLKFDKVTQDLRSTIHRGVNGAYCFGNSGQVGLAFPYDTMDPSISNAHLVFQIQENMHKILSPAPYTDGKFRLPAWCKA